MTGTDEYPPRLARTLEGWKAYWVRQSRLRRARRSLRIRAAVLRRRLAAPRRWYYRLRAFSQRGRRGWARTDLWSMDDYACQLLGSMVAEMRATGHGYPCQGDGSCAMQHPAECTCQRDWDDTLDRISGPLLAYRSHWDFGDGEPATEHVAREKRIISEAQDALRLMADHLPSLWD